MNNLNNIKNKIIIISSPSGAGKTTICRSLLRKFNNIEISISCTTRPKRKNEKNGQDYFFNNELNKHVFSKSYKEHINKLNKYRLKN